MNAAEQSQSAVEAVLGLPLHARVILIGATDTGKTTLAASLMRVLTSVGKAPVAVVDGDLGQSEIGAPGVVGLGLLSAGGADALAAETRSYARIPGIAGVFVGAVSPQSCALETASAVIQMAQTAALLTPRPACTLIDTPGYVTGIGASLLRTVIEVVRPHLIIALARGAELEPILRQYEASGAGRGVSVHREPIAASIGRKTTAIRATRRAARFAQHLSGARQMQLTWAEPGSLGSLHAVTLEKTMISYGAALAPHEMKFIGQTLGTRCAYAERMPDGDLLVITSGPAAQTRSNAPLAGRIGIVEQSLRARRVILDDDARYEGLLCGLLSGKGDLLAIGIIDAIDFARRSVRVLTPLRSADAAARLAFGAVRLRMDGRELG